MLRRPKKMALILRTRAFPYIEREAMTGRTTSLRAAEEVVDNAKTGLVFYGRRHRAP